MAKKYGEPYSEKHWLKPGDYLEITANTPYSYESVAKQISGDRRLQPEIKAYADKLVKQRKALVDEISK